MVILKRVIKSQERAQPNWKKLQKQHLRTKREYYWKSKFNWYTLESLLAQRLTVCWWWWRMQFVNISKACLVEYHRTVHFPDFKKMSNLEHQIEIINQAGGLPTVPFLKLSYAANILLIMYSHITFLRSCLRYRLQQFISFHPQHRSFQTLSTHIEIRIGCSKN